MADGGPLDLSRFGRPVTPAPVKAGKPLDLSKFGKESAPPASAPSPVDKFAHGFNEPQPPAPVAPVTPQVTPPAASVTPPPPAPQTPALPDAPKVTTPPAPVTLPAPLSIGALAGQGASQLPARPAPNPFGGGNNTLPGGPGLRPGQTTTPDNSDLRPFGKTLTSVADGIKSGTEYAAKSIGQTAQTVTGGTPKYEAPPDGAALPSDWSNGEGVGRWLGFQIGQTAPAAVATAGTLGVASWLFGPEVGALGTAAAGGVALGAVGFVQTLGPLYAQNIATGMPKQDAFNKAFEDASKAGALGAIGGAAFAIAPFKSALANIFLQSSIVQPAITVTAKVQENVAGGKAPLDGVTADYVQTALGTLVPVAAFHGALSVLAGKPPAPKSSPEEIAAFLDQARAAQAADKAPGDSAARQREIFAAELKKEGWADADAEALLAKVFGEPTTAPAGTPPAALPPPAPPGAAAAAPAAPEPPRGPAPAPPETRPPETPAPTAKPATTLDLSTFGKPVGTGVRSEPIPVTHPDDIARAGEVVHPTPTPAQAEAGNYQKGHVTIPGLEGFPVSIETAGGGIRSGIGHDGEPWQVQMPAAYGYFRRTNASDGQQLDVFLGPEPQSGKAFIINQKTTDGRFDELKVILGARDEAQARDLYLKSFSGGHGEKVFGGIHELGLPDLKTFLQTAGAAEKPYIPPRQPIQPQPGEVPRTPVAASPETPPRNAEIAPKLLTAAPKPAPAAADVPNVQNVQARTPPPVIALPDQSVGMPRPVAQPLQAATPVPKITPVSAKVAEAAGVAAQGGGAPVASWHGEAEALAPERAQEALADPAVKAALARPHTVDHGQHIKYLAGYSNDGHTIYIDKDVPTVLRVRTLDGKLGRMDPTPFLVLHERIEKALIDVRHYSYQGAHQIAVGAEHAALEAAGWDPKSYEASLAKVAPKILAKDLAKAPANLDVTPYRDSDEAIPAKMEMPNGPHGEGGVPAERPDLQSATAGLSGGTADAGTGVAGREAGPGQPQDRGAAIADRGIPERAPQAGVVATPRPARGGAKPTDLLRAIISVGGIKDSGAASKGDLRAMGAYKRPGLINRAGRSLDYMREHLAQLGYFDHLYGNPAEAATQSTVADLVDLIDRSLRGEKIYPPEQGALVEAQSDRQAAAKAQDAAERAIDDALAEGGLTDDPALRAAALDVLMREGGDAGDAVERAAISLYNEEATPAERAKVDAIPGWEAEVQTDAADVHEGGGDRVEAGPPGVGEEVPRHREAQAIPTVEGSQSGLIAKPDDLPYGEAEAAYRNMSMTPDRRARQEQADYAHHINDLHESMLPLAKSDEQKAVLRSEVEHYRQGYLSRLRSVLATRSRTASSMVTGPARFPVAKNRKALDAEQKKSEELQAWSARAQAAIKKRLSGARTEDQVADEAWTDLRKRIDRDISIISDINSGKMAGYDRTAFTGSVVGRLKRLASNGEVALVNRAVEYIRAAQAGMAKPLFTERSPLWSLGETAAKVEAAPKAAGTVDHATFAGGRIVINHDLNRIQIVFDAKPEGEVREKLRGSGWRWAPSEGAWQRQNTPNALYDARRITGAVEARAAEVPPLPQRQIPPDEVPEWAEVLYALPKVASLGDRGDVYVATGIMEQVAGKPTAWNKLNDAQKVEVYRRVKALSGPAVEATPAGAQTVLPGAEQDAAGLARQRAAAPLKPKAEQNLTAGGPLFTHEEDSRQGDLLAPQRSAMAAPQLFKPFDGSGVVPEEHANIVNNVQSIVSRILGKNAPKIVYHDVITTEDVGPVSHSIEEAAAASGRSGWPTVGGYHQYTPGLPDRSLIAVAIGDYRYRPGTVASHEAWHDVWQWLLTDGERAALQRDAGRGADSTLRRYAADEFRTGPDDPLVMEMPVEELTAYAFQRFDREATQRETTGGLHIAFRKLFAKLRSLFQTIRRMLNRRGYERVEDIFGRVSRGEMGNRDPIIRDEAQPRRSAMAGVTPRAEPGPPPTKENVRRIDDAMFRLRSMTQDDRIEFRKSVQGIQKEIRASKAQYEPTPLYRYGEGDPTAKLTPSQQKFWDRFIAPDKATEDSLHTKAVRLARKTGLSDDEASALVSPGYMHRMVKGKTPELDALLGGDWAGNPTTGGRSARSLKQMASSMKARVYFALQSPSGERTVISNTAKGIYRWDAKTGTRIAEANPDLQPGATITVDGEPWTVATAYTREIEANAGTEYYKDPIIATKLNILHLKQVIRNLQFMKDLKASDEFIANYTSGINQGPPDGWVRVDAPGLHGWLHPKIGNIINDYMHGVRLIEGGSGGIIDTALERLEGLNRLSTGSLFMSPTPHLWNVGTHAFVARGWGWANPMGYARFASTGMRALKAVITHDQLYREYLRSGASLVGSRISDYGFVEKALRNLGHDIAKNRPAWRRYLGIPGDAVAGFVRGWYRASSLVLWHGNDVFMIQRYLELEKGGLFGKGLPRDKAVEETEKLIPRYRDYHEVMGSRLLAKAMQDPSLGQFMHYRLDQFRAWFNTAKKVFRGEQGKTLGGIKARWEGLGELAAGAFLWAVIMPAIGYVATQILAGMMGKNSPTVSVSPKGPLTIPADLAGVIDGSKNALGVLGTLWSQPAFSPISILWDLAEQFRGAELATIPPSKQKSPNKELVTPIPFHRKGDTSWTQDAERRVASLAGKIPGLSVAQKTATTPGPELAYQFLGLNVAPPAAGTAAPPAASSRPRVTASPSRGTPSSAPSRPPAQTQGRPRIQPAK